MTNRLDRRSVRLRGFDYSGEATFFITICSWQRKHIFGIIKDGQFVASPSGLAVAAAWERTVEIRRELVPHGFVVMPNHVHALFSLDPSSLHPATIGCPVEGADALQSVTTNARPRRPAHSVPTIIGGFKGDATRRIWGTAHEHRFRVWQERYHDRVVRNQQEFDTILQYIETNPQRWAEDRYSNL